MGENGGRAMMTLQNRWWHTRMRWSERFQKLRHAISPSRLRVVTYSWPLRVAVCPCDADLCDFLRDRQLRSRSIFHFGSGGHHLVGVRNLADGLDNDVLAITLAPSELRTYVDRVVRDPALARHYKVLFADIHSLDSRTLPMFDIVTLFHLGEFGDEASAARRVDDAAVLELFISRLAPRGLMLFYPHSFAYAKVTPLIDQAVARRQLEFVENVRSLSVYRRVAG